MAVTVKDFVTSSITVIEVFRSKSHYCAFERRERAKCSTPLGVRFRARTHMCTPFPHASSENVNYPATVSRWYLVAGRFSLDLLIIWIANSWLIENETPSRYWGIRLENYICEMNSTYIFLCSWKEKCHSVMSRCDLLRANLLPGNVNI